MRWRDFEIGDMIICESTGVIGKAIRFYFPTACEEQTMVRTRDGRKYHAPTRMWRKIAETERLENHTEQKLLNPYGEYAVKFAENHGMSINEAMQQPMVKARLEFFNATGM